MTDHDPLPRGLTPRLLSTAQAAAYCGVSEDRFEQSTKIKPIKIFGTRKLWDIRVLDKWLDDVSAISDDQNLTIEERLNGNPGRRN